MIKPHQLEVILFEPEIPQNTGNVTRTCSVTGTSLTLVEPLGFSISDRMLKRAGLDYWEGVPFKTIQDLPLYLEEEQRPFFFFSSKATKSHWETEIPANSQLIFGSETKGLPPELLNAHPEKCVTLPMLKDKRCLNLATSVGIALYEVLRKLEYNR